MSNITRIFMIHDKLSRRSHFNAQEIADILEVSKSTIYRDIDYMKDHLKAPVVFDREKGTYTYDSGTDFQLPAMWFNSQEIHTLLAINSLLKSLDSDHSRYIFEDLTHHVSTLLYNTGYDAQFIINHISIKPFEARPAPPRIFAKIVDSMLNKKTLEMTYKSRTTLKLSERTIEPQKAVHYRNTWYLVAHCRSTTALRTFSLDRIVELTKTSEPYEMYPTEKIDEYIDNGFGIFIGKQHNSATLMFTPQAALWVKDEKWHPDQEGELNPDGSYTLKLPYSDPTELVMEIMRHGPHVEVIEPPELRKSVATRVYNTQKLYREFRKKRYNRNGGRYNENINHR
ncbi:MAG: transcriptional regulator [Deltaproteobacteria bacterium]|nr:transcriptional regulator [Deltaproteobacteria bacterium]